MVVVMLKTISYVGCSFVLWLVSLNVSASVVLNDWIYHIDGAVSYYGDPLPGSVDTTAFDEVSGLGRIDISLTGAGNHRVALWLDHEIEESTNTFANEQGAAIGTAVSGLSWEIDEPGFGSFSDGTAGSPYYGDVVSNVEAGLLDDQVFYDAVDDQSLLAPNDVSMALAWDFTLAAGEQALVRFLLSDVLLPTGFYLRQRDIDSGEEIYFSSTLDITTSAVGVPEPGSWGLILSGMLMLMWRKLRGPYSRARAALLT